MQEETILHQLAIKMDCGHLRILRALVSLFFPTITKLSNYFSRK